jgi:hypothetical protein
MKRYPIVRLAGDLSLHAYTGWDANGHVLIESNSRESALKHGAAFVRNNASGIVMRVENSRQHRITPQYVNPCLACGSLEHKTYSRKCVKAA